MCGLLSVITCMCDPRMPAVVWSLLGKNNALAAMALSGAHNAYTACRYAVLLHILM